MRISENYWNYRNYIVTYVVRSLVLRSFVCSIYRSYFVRTIARAYEYDRSCLRSLVHCLRSLVLTIVRPCVRSLVLTIARAYDRSDRSCVRLRTIARAYDRSCVRSLVIVLTIARAYDRSDRSCLRSLVAVLTIARAYGRRSIVVGVTGFKLTISMCSLIR